jgi:D-alanyl-D-alanine carboxypeptidase (penicillin-binding protein 5/6)
MAARPAAVFATFWLIAAAAVTVAVVRLPMPVAAQSFAASPPRSPAAPLDPPPAGPAAAALIDAPTGRVLYERDAHRHLAPASTTKILTAVMAIERFAPEATIVVGRSAAAFQTGSRVGLVAGERWRIEDLLYALILGSANDAAVAIAEASSGSVRAFAAQMTDRARRIGARGSRFANPHGLDDPDHYSTAYDLAVLGRHALSHARFAAVARAQSWVLSRPGRPAEELVNRNRLLGRYPGADGIKTGMTPRAGYTFVASATREGWQLVAVVLRSQDVYVDAGRLLDYGFGSFAPVTLATRGTVVATVAVGDPPRRVDGVVPDDVRAVVRRGAALERRVTWRTDLRLPIAAGQRVGAVVFLEESDEVARSPLVAGAWVGP